jgi:predicted nucleic acid-binding protein
LITYLDTSALLKQYIQEAGSEDVEKLLRSSDIAGSNMLTYAEMASAIVRAVRMKLIPKEEARATWEDFLVDWDLLVRFDVSAQLIKRASVLIWEDGLRSYDAMHLASALVWQETIEMPVTLATYDRELWASAKKAGIAVWPE